MCDDSIKKYTEDLGSNNPVPGGGSAAALIGSLGAGLLEKACNFTIGREKYKAVEKDIRNILDKAAAARSRLVELIELDKKAFLPVAKAYKLPKDTDKQKAVRKQKIGGANKEAAKVPAEIIQICSSIVFYCDKLEKDGNQLFVSDVKCARQLLKAAAQAAENFI